MQFKGGGAKKQAGKVFTPEESTEILTYIAQNMAMKSDVDALRVDVDILRSDIKASEQRVMDYTDKRVTQAEGRIMGTIRKVDEKIDEHIFATERAGVVSLAESKRLRCLGPFSKFVG